MISNTVQKGNRETKDIIKDGGGITRLYHIWLIVLLSLMTAFDAMSIDMYLPSFSAIRSYFGTDAGTVQLSLSVFLVGLAVGQAIYGPLIDLFGRLVPLLIGLRLFSLTSMLIAMSPNIEIFIGGRFVQGLGAAAGLVIPRAIISDLFDEGRAAKIYSLLMQVAVVAPIVAPPAGGLILSRFGWAAVFWLLVLLGMSTFAATAFTIKETLPKAARVSTNRSHPLKGYGVLLRNRYFLRLTLSGSFIMGSLFAYISGAPFVFTEYFTLSPKYFGYLFAVNAAGIMLFGQLNYFLLDKWTDRQILPVGLFLHVGAAGLLCAAIIAGVNTFWVIAGLVFLLLASLGLVFGNVTSVVMRPGSSFCRLPITASRAGTPMV